MVAGPSHAPEHHEAHGQPAAANTMHFNNGGVLGLTESIAKLLKGVTYDATAETFGGSHGAAHGAAGHAEHTAHGAEAHGHEAPHGEAAHGAAHGDAHGAAGHAEGAHGHDDDDKDLSDRFVQFLLGAGHYGVALPFIGKGLQWAKTKLFPEIHKITVDHDHLGNQILYELKKDKKAAKKNKLVLDHHALEGFCQGLEVANLGTTLKMFTNEARFNGALDRDSGKEELKKEIANVLKLTGDVDRDEVEKATSMLIELLGGHIEGGHDHEHIGFHAVDSRVQAQHKALTDIIKNARSWLTPGVLAKIYGYEKKEEAYDMDYKGIGDHILKLNDKTLKPFLNRIKIDGIDDVEIRVGDLLNPGNLVEELRHNPDDLRDQIQNLFDVKGNVTLTKLKERLDQMKKKLKAHTVKVIAYEEVDRPDPADASKTIKVKVVVEEEVDEPDPANPGTMKKVKRPKKIDQLQSNSGNPELDVVGASLLEVLEKAVNNLQKHPEVMTKLYPLAEDAEAAFKWTDIKYTNFGATVFEELNDKNRVSFLNGFEGDRFKRAFNHLLPGIKADLLKTTEGKKKIRNQVAALLRLEQPFEKGDIAREVASIKTHLGKGINPPTPESIKLYDVNVFLDEIYAALTDTVVEELFAEVSVVGPENFVNTFTVLDEDSTIKAYIRGYKSSKFKGHFVYLFDGGELDELFRGGSDQDRREAIKQVQDFVGIKKRKLNAKDLEDALKDYTDQLDRVESTLSAEDKKFSAAIRADLGAIKETLMTDDPSTGKNRLSRLFGPDVEVDMNHLGEGIAKVDDEKLIKFLESVDFTILTLDFGYVSDPNSIDKITTQQEANDAKDQLAKLLGVPATKELSMPNIVSLVTVLRAKLTTMVTPRQLAVSPKANQVHQTLIKMLDGLINELSDERLKKVYRKDYPKN